MSRPGLVLAGLAGLALAIPTLALSQASPPTAKPRSKAKTVKKRPRRKAPPPAELTPQRPPALPSTVDASLRDLKPLSNSKKIALLSATGMVVSVGDLHSPFVLTPRSPYLDGDRYLSFLGSIVVDPHHDPPRADFSECQTGACTSWPELHFRAYPHRTYLVDCTGVGSNEYDILVYRGGQPQTMRLPAEQGHVTAVLPARNTSQLVSMMIMGVGNAGWTFSGCEVTSVE